MSIGIENVGAAAITGAIGLLKGANPDGYMAFKKGLVCVNMGLSAMIDVLDDDQASPEEMKKVIGMAQDYVATRVLQDVLWGLLKHVPIKG